MFASKRAYFGVFFSGRGEVRVQFQNGRPTLKRLPVLLPLPFGEAQVASSKYRPISLIV